MIVAELVGAGAGPARRRARVRGGRQRQLPRHERAARRRRPVRRRPARGRRGDDGRRLRADQRAASAVLTVHQGCGLTNAMTGIAEAAKSRTPLLVLAADTGAAAVRSNFRIDQDALVTRRRRGAPSGCTRRRRRVADIVRAVPDGRRAAAHRGAQPAAGRAGRRRARTRPLPAVPALAPVRPAAGAVAELAALLAAARAPGVRRRARRARRAGRELRALGRGVRRAARHLGGGPRAVRGRPVGARHLRRVRLAAGRRADPGRRPGRRLGLRAEHVDDPARHADRPGAHGGAGRPRRRTRSARTGPSTWACSATSRPPPRDVLAAVVPAAPATGPTPSGRRSRTRVRWRDVPYDDLTGAGRHRPADAVDRRWTTCCPRERTVAVDSGNFMGYPSAYLAVPGRGRVLLHPGVPVDRARAGHRDRRGAGPAGPAAGRRARRRRRADGGRRAGDGGAAGAADGRGGLRRPRLRRRGAPLPRRATTPRSPSPTPTSPRSAAGFGFEAVTVRAPADLEGVADWVAGPRRAPAAGARPIASDGGSWWLAEAFRGH